jgi:hypothetical protein
MDKQTYQGNYIVGAYATSPNLFSWNESSELEYFDAIKRLQSIRGLELPFWGKSLHPFDDQWLLNNLDPTWENVLTCLPGTMANLANDIHFGLASSDENSRKAAIGFYEIALQSIQKLKAKNGENSLHAIHLSSSPRNLAHNQYASADSFENSLNEILDWEWGETKITVEHCDAWTPQNNKPQKGFLKLEEEIEVINIVNEKHDADIGLIINWGRSAIELQDVNGAKRHIELANQHNLLHGLMFSGTTNNDANLYGRWSDLHMPPAPHQKNQFGESESLMSLSEINNVLSVCDFSTLGYLGIKLLAMPNDSTIEKRVGINYGAMMMIDEVVEELI